MLDIYTFVMSIIILVFISINIKLFSAYKFWPFLFYLLYAYTLPILSNLYLEQGIYITEQERYSYFTGSTFRLLFYTSIFLLICFFSLQLFQHITSKKKVFISKRISRIKPKSVSMSLFYIVILMEFLMYLNLFASEIPLFSPSITRFNYWESSCFPFLRQIIGNISLPIAMILGIYYMYFSNNNLYHWRKKTIFLFLLYIVYLYLIGQKFSAQFLAIYFFFLPYWVINFKKASLFLFSKRSLKYILPIGLLIFGFILYKYQFTGISEMKGSAWSGMIYRILGLQGHVYWGIDEMVFHQNLYGWHYFSEFLRDNWNGLLLEMNLIGPSNLDWYLEHNIQFTAGYPAILLLINPILAIFIQMVFAFIFSLSVFYTYTMLLYNNIVRSFFGLMIIFQIQYGLSMGNFQFFYSIKFIIPLVGILIIEILYIFMQREVKG